MKLTPAQKSTLEFIRTEGKLAIDGKTAKAKRTMLEFMAYENLIVETYRSGSVSQYELPKEVEAEIAAEPEVVVEPVAKVAKIVKVENPKSKFYTELIEAGYQDTEFRAADKENAKAEAVRLRKLGQMAVYITLTTSKTKGVSYGVFSKESDRKLRKSGNRVEEVIAAYEQDDALQPNIVHKVTTNLRILEKALEMALNAAEADLVHDENVFSNSDRAVVDFIADAVKQLND